MTKGRELPTPNRNHAGITKSPMTNDAGLASTIVKDNQLVADPNEVNKPVEVGYQPRT